MSLFSKRQRAVVPANVTAELASYGQAMIDSRRTARPMSDPRFQWDWSGPVVMALTGESKDGVIGELYRAATGARQRDQAIELDCAHMAFGVSRRATRAVAREIERFLETVEG